MSNVEMNNILQQIQTLKAQAQGKVGNEAADNKLDFGELLKKSIDSVNEVQQQSSKLKTAFEQGDPNVDLAQVMIASQKASVSFQTMLQVRNKLLEAYKDIKSMPV